MEKMSVGMNQGLVGSGDFEDLLIYGTVLGTTFERWIVWDELRTTGTVCILSEMNKSTPHAVKWTSHVAKIELISKTQNIWSRGEEQSTVADKLFSSFELIVSA